MNYYVDAVRKYSVFAGRATRKQYWMFVLFNAIITFILSFIGSILGIHFLVPIYVLFVLLPSLALASRRLHDTGRSAWWLLILFIPVIGSFVILIFAVLDSQTGTNAYGQNPKGDAYVAEKTNIWLIVIVCVLAFFVMMVLVSMWGFLSLMKNSHAQVQTQSQVQAY